jgi:hypothetical protein
MRKRLAVLLTVVLGATFFVATATGASASVADQKKETKCNAKKSAKGIQKSFNTFFLGETGEDKVKNVDLTKEEAVGVAAAIQKSSDAAAAGGQTQTGRDTLSTSIVVTCQGKTGASFTYDLLFKDQTTGTTTPPLGLSFIGDAVLKKGVWKISGATVCDLTAQNPASPDAGADCYKAIGLDVPAG